jgi:hypothetical protein
MILKLILGHRERNKVVGLFKSGIGERSVDVVQER